MLDKPTTITGCTNALTIFRRRIPFQPFVSFAERIRAEVSFVGNLSSYSATSGSTNTAKKALKRPCQHERGEGRNVKRKPWFPSLAFRLPIRRNRVKVCAHVFPLDRQKLAAHTQIPKKESRRCSLTRPRLSKSRAWFVPWVQKLYNILQMDVKLLHDFDLSILGYMSVLYVAAPSSWMISDDCRGMAAKLQLKNPWNIGRSSSHCRLDQVLREARARELCSDDRFYNTRWAAGLLDCPLLDLANSSIAEI